MNLQTLPDVVLAIIINKLNGGDAANCRPVNRDFKAKVNANYNQWSLTVANTKNDITPVGTLTYLKVKKAHISEWGRGPGMSNYPANLKFHHPKFLQELQCTSINREINCQELQKILLTTPNVVKLGRNLSSLTVNCPEFSKSLYAYPFLQTLDLRMDDRYLTSPLQPDTLVLYAKLLRHSEMPQATTMTTNFEFVTRPAYKQILTEALFTFIERTSEAY